MTSNQGIWREPRRLDATGKGGQRNLSKMRLFSNWRPQLWRWSIPLWRSVVWNYHRYPVSRRPGLCQALCEQVCHFPVSYSPGNVLSFLLASKSTHEKLAPQMLTTGASCNQRYIKSEFKHYCRAVSFPEAFLLCAFYWTTSTPATRNIRIPSKSSTVSGIAMSLTMSSSYGACKQMLPLLCAATVSCTFETFVVVALIHNYHRSK